MLKLYNTLTKQKEEFKPINAGKVGMYVCGPTVYDHCHLGHARGYVAMDVLRRYLKYSGYEVRHIMNYTDVGHLVGNAEIGEDKIEQKAKKEKINPTAIADTYIKSCQEDFDALNIKPANFNPRPTKYIAQIIKFNEELIKKGFAYVSNGSVYFSIEKFPEYGKLSGKKIEDLKSGSRIEINPEKKNPLDFALWIKATKEHILKWESPWSIGYPGWHIECSVMSNDLLGQDTFDIHGGGNENAFPHNENEIAQSEAYLGKKMANYWVHWNMVMVNGQKMSKSLRNFITIKNVVKEYGAMVIRLWILSSHYRSIASFNKTTALQAEANLSKLKFFKDELNNCANRHIINIEKNPTTRIDLKEYKNRFKEGMNDDLNTPVALSTIYELISEINKQYDKLDSKQAKEVLSFLDKVCTVLGLKIPEVEIIPSGIIKLAKSRKQARIGSDFKKSDEIRKEIEKKGYIIKDLKESNYKISKK